MIFGLFCFVFLYSSPSSFVVQRFALSKYIIIIIIIFIIIHSIKIKVAERTRHVKQVMDSSSVLVAAERGEENIWLV